MNAYDKASMVFLPHLRKAGKAYALKPTNGNGDLLVDRNCPAFEINSAGKLELVVANMPRYNHAVLGGCSKLLLEPEGTNLHEQAIKLGHSDYLKSYSKIIGDESSTPSNAYTSDYSAGTDGINIVRVGASGNNDGVNDGATSKDDCFKFYANADNSTHYIYKSPYGTEDVGDYVKFSFWYYIPSTNTNVDGFHLSNGITETPTPTVGTWAQFSIFASLQNNRVDIKMTAGGSSSFIGANSASDDIIYIKDLKIDIYKGFASPCIDFPNHAFKFVDNTVNGSHLLNAQNIVTIAATNYVNMVCAKKLEHTWIALAFDNLADSFAWFDLNNGVIGTVQANVTAKMIEIADGFYICSIKATVPGTNNVPEFYLADADNSINFPGNGTDGVLLFLADFKKTSVFMLPVYDGVDGVTTTRLRDLINTGGDISIINSEEGTLHIRMSALSNDLSDRFISLSDGTLNNRVNIYYGNASNRIFYIIKVGGVTVASGNYTVADITDFHDIIVKWKVNEFALFVEGGKQASSNNGVSFGTNVLTKYSCDADNNGNSPAYSEIEKIILYQTALSDADCIALAP